MYEVNELKIDRNSKLFALNLDIDFEISQSDFVEKICELQKSDCDILSLSFPIKSLNEVDIACDKLKFVLPFIHKPLMICGSSDNEIDKILLQKLINVLDRSNCIISYVNDVTYKDIIPSVIIGGHYVVLKTPIDITLAKELNILSIDLGLNKDKIIMNTDIGGLGYGYEYGFSIMEKIVIEGKKGDEYLNLPLISDASGESLKTKEAKSNDFSDSWGSIEERSRMIELSACAGVLSAGANIIMMNYFENVSIMKGLV